MKRPEKCPVCGDRLVGLYYQCAPGKRMATTGILYCRQCETNREAGR